MTEIARELLEDVSPGDFVCIRYGTDSSQASVEGTILTWTENFLKLQKKDGGTAKIRLDDSLRALDQLGAAEAPPPQPRPVSAPPAGSEPSAPPAPSPRPAPQPHVGNAPFQVMRQMAALPQAPQYHFSFAPWNSRLRKLLKECSNTSLRKEMISVLDSLQGAVKNHDVTYKYHNLRAKIHTLWDVCNCDIDYQIFYLSIGVLAITAEDWSFALEPLVRVGEYSLAAYAASTGGFQDQAEVCSLCALLSGESQNGITQYISELCIKRKDADVLSELLELYQDDQERTEQIASCAYMMFQESKGRLYADITPYASASQAARLLLEAIPPEWMLPSTALKCWNEYKKYTFPAPILENADLHGVQEGRIIGFNREKCYGFLSNAQGDRFFHIKQVLDNCDEGLLLRRLLYQDQANQLEVRFRLGLNSTNTSKPSASDVELTEEGLHDAKRRLAQGAASPDARYQGYTEFVDPDGKNYSYIRSYNRAFKFKVTQEYIADPYLRAYFLGCYDPQSQDVTFEAVGDKAFDICWLDPSPEDLSTYESDVPEADRRAWESFSQARNLDPAQSSGTPAEDPFEQFYYSSLPDWTGPQGSRGTPFTWDVERKPTVTYTPPTPPKAIKAAARVTPTTFVLGSPSGTGLFAEKGRRAAIKGDLEEAEQAFKQEMETNGVSESVVADLTMLYIRQEDRINDALALLEQHGSCLTPEKLLNIKIQVYDKKKDYQALLPLYEQSFQLAASASKKSHNLVRMIDAQLKLSRYKDALESCQRWESFYQQNRFRSDAGKIKNVVPTIERHKAICYYNLGQIDAAKKIATDLIRSNPADEAANNILNGTLAGSAALDDSALDTYVQDEADGAFDDEAGGSESLITRFVRSKIQQTDIGVSLKSPYLKDGKYTGPSETALEDVNRLVRRQRGVSMRTRSDSLFAACKLQEQIEQRGDGSIRNPYYKFRLAGRAMASWGDCMVSQVSQLDTTRMAYLFSLRVLTPSRKGSEQDWINSFNRYLKSYFLARVGSNSLDDYINQQANIGEKDGANTDIFVGHQIPDVLMPEFLVGILNLIDALEQQPDWQQSLLEDLYSKNPVLRRSLCRQLEAFLGQSVSGDSGLLEFSRDLRAGRDLLQQRMEQLSQSLVEAGNLLMSVPLPDSLLQELDQPEWKFALTATDLSRLGQLHYALKRAQDYFCNGDFESRADCLRSAISEVKELLQAVQNEPTDVSYDIFLPALDQIHMRLADKQTSLYQDFQPKLSWEESLQPFRTPEGHIQIQLTVRNELNYQTADTLQISRVTGGEIQWYDKVEPVPSLRGGEDTEISLVVGIDESASQSGSFSVTLGCTYKCNDSPQNTITKSQEADFTFVIHNDDFERLKNPFMAYEGKPMDDDSMFFGRSDQINQIVDMLCPGNGEMNYGRAIAMYGQTRTGKSSLMYHLKKRLEERYPDKVIIWDIGNIGELAVRSSEAYMASFLYHLLDVGSEALYENDILADILEEEVLEPPLEQILASPAFAEAHFTTYMKKLTAILRREDRMIVLMADEFTYIHGYIKEGKISSDFMRFWKALLQNYCVFAIVAGQDDMPEFMREYQNEFACMELLKLTYLEERDAKRLIQEPLERINGREGLFRRDAVDRIYQLTAGSAYLTIILCSKLVNYLNEKGAYQVTRGIVSDFLRTKAFGPKSFLTEVHFEAQLQERGHREYDAANKEILLSIARLSQTTGRADVNAIQCSGLDPEEIQRLVDRLVDRNVLVKEGRDQYWIQVKLLEKWLISTMGV